MTTTRNEGFVIVALLAASTITMMMIVGICCFVGSRHYRLNSNQVKRAEVLMLQDGTRDEEYGAVPRSFLNWA